MPEPIQVAILMPMYDHMEPETHRCLRHLDMPKWITPHVVDVLGRNIDSARRMLTEEVLRFPEITHTLWLDGDMTFAPDTLTRLLAHDVDMVGGLCFSRHTPYHPIIGRTTPEWVQRDAPLGFIYNYPPDALFECDGTGAAVLLVKTSVYRAINEKYGEAQWWVRGGADPQICPKCKTGYEHQYGGEISEDFSFCERVKGCGFKIFIDTGCKCGHLGKVEINEETAAKLRPFTWEAWMPDLTKETINDGAPAASVIIPTYNQQPKLLRAAILSAAHQTIPVEVIVVDDGSDPPVVQEKWWPKNVRLIRQDNKGVAGALNTGIENMKTDWFCWLSSDDMFSTKKVEMQLACLQQARMKASYTRWQEIYTGTWSAYATIDKWRTIPEQMGILARFCAINGSTVMLHRSVFDAVGRFDESYRYGQDYEMWCRIGEKYLFLPIDEILTSRRELPDNLTKQSMDIPENKKLKDDEDERIHQKYAKWVSAPGGAQ